MPETTLYVGIDPGLTGAVGWYIDRERMGVIDTPIAEVKVGRTKRKRYMAGEMVAALRGVGRALNDSPFRFSVQVAIESGIPFPGQSSSTTFTTGRGGGLWEGICAGLELPYVMVAPKDWKKVLGLPAGSDKQASRVLAAQLFPELVSSFARVKDDGRAEAMLICEWRRRLG